MASKTSTTTTIKPVEDKSDAASSEENEKLKEIFDHSPALQELCLHNGLSFKQLLKARKKLESLDMFLGFWPSMKPVEKFSMLKQLTIIQQSEICEIDGLSSCPLLESLWITECSLTSMRGLETCTKLKVLHLSSNKIKKIESISQLKSLNTLWLNRNQIKSLDGLQGLENLETLWLCGNQIKYIQNYLESNTNLREINISENSIGCLKELLHFDRLPKLVSLSLCDPHFGENPVCRLCNYRTYVMCQLTNLTCLDAMKLSEDTKNVAESTFLKKKMYYNMRIKTLYRNIRNVVRIVQVRKSQMEKELWEHEAFLAKENALVTQQVEVETDSNNIHNKEELAYKKKKLDEFKISMISAARSLVRESEVSATQLLNVADTNRSRLMLELDTAGNVRLEDGKKSDAWFQSCDELVQSRFFPAQFEQYGITGIKVTRVTRIHNRYLRNRFEAGTERLDASDVKKEIKSSVSKTGVTTTTAADANDVDKKSPKTATTIKRSSSKRSSSSLEYLFYCDDDGQAMAEFDSMIKIAEYGFKVESNKDEDIRPCIQLSNSVALSSLPSVTKSLYTRGCDLKMKEVDEEILEKLSSSSVFETVQNSEVSKAQTSLESIGNTWSLPNARVIVSKVCLGECISVLPSEKTFDYKTFGNCESAQVPHPSDSRQSFYHAFESDLVLPEYIVEFKYIMSSDQNSTTSTTTSSDNDVASLSAMLNEIQDSASAVEFTPQEKADLIGASDTVSQFVKKSDRILVLQREVASSKKSILNLRPTIPARPVLGDTSSSNVTRLTGCTDFSLITYINFVDNGIEKLSGLEACENLKVLVLSFNKLTSLDGIDTLRNLSRLEADHNAIQTVEGLERLDNLRELGLSHNLLRSVDTIHKLANDVPKILEKIDLRCNPLCALKGYRSILMKSLESLCLMDGLPITVHEKKESKNVITSISEDVILSRGKLMNEEQIVGNVEELYLNDACLSNISNLQKAVNLRRASFMNNGISRIENLENCTALEELNLEENQMSSVEGLDQLTHLKTLCLGKNRISVINNMKSLTNLTQLSVEDNNISSLSGVSCLTSLMELYACNNRIEDLKEIQNLKSLAKLIILDVSGNALCKDENFRHYSIYYLRRIRVLNGRGISGEEQNEAKQKYAGKLTTEFLMEKIGGNFECIEDLELSSCRIRQIESLNGCKFLNLKELNLDHNLIVDISGLDSLPVLKVLKLNHNRIERLVHPSNAIIRDEPFTRSGIQACPELQVLELGNNQISDMTGLGLHLLPNLSVLRLEGNNIKHVSGLNFNYHLKELNLCRNKIKMLDENSTSSLMKLEVLNLDENAMRTLNNFNNMALLQALSLTGNRVSEVDELEGLADLPKLASVNLHLNPVSKKQLYRPSVIYKLPEVRILDGKEVTMEERERVGVIFNSDRQQATNPTLSNPQAASGGALITFSSYGGSSTAADQMTSKLPLKFAPIKVSAPKPQQVQQHDRSEIQTQSTFPSGSAVRGRSQQETQKHNWSMKKGYSNSGRSSVNPQYLTGVPLSGKIGPSKSKGVSSSLTGSGRKIARHSSNRSTTSLGRATKSRSYL